MFRVWRPYETLESRKARNNSTVSVKEIPCARQHCTKDGHGDQSHDVQRHADFPNLGGWLFKSVVPSCS